MGVGMVESVTLSSVHRQLLTARADLSRARNTAVMRLATGRRVSSISDDPVSFLQAQALTFRVSALRDAKANISQGISALQATSIGNQAIEDLTRQLKGIAIAAQNADPAQRAELAQQFDTVRRQIDNIAADTSYQGVNLISNPAGELDITVSDRPDDSVTIEGRSSDVSSLGIGNAASFNNFADQADINAAVAAIESAIDKIQANESDIVSNASLLNTRERFAEDFANVLREGADKLTRADMNEEAARLLAANARDALITQSQRIAAQADQLIVDLIRGK